MPKKTVQSAQTNKTKVLVQSALLLAIAVVLRNFSYMVYMGGGAGMRLGVSGFFTKLTSLMFGPLYGGLSSALLDLLGYVLKPDGAYIFPITISSCIGGIITGFLYKAIKNKPTGSMRKGYLAFTFAIGLAGLFNHLCFVLHPNGIWGQILVSLGTKVNFFIVGFYAVCVFGLAVYGINMYLTKKYSNSFMDDFLKLFVVFLISDILVTTANTYILIAFIPALAKLGFWVFYLPRLAQEVLAVFISSCAVSYLMHVLKRINVKL